MCRTLGCFVCVFFFSSRRRHTRLQGDWSSDVCSSDLYTLLGDVQWKDYEVSVDFLLETNGFAYLLGRVANVPGFGTPTPNGYWLAVSSVPGAWELHNASGIIASGSATVATNTWHQLRLS